MPLNINFREHKSDFSIYYLVKDLLGKVHDSITLKMFLRLLKKGRVYSCLSVAFFVNISTPLSSGGD